MKLNPKIKQALEEYKNGEYTTYTIEEMMSKLDFDEKPRHNYEEENKLILLKVIGIVAFMIFLLTLVTTLLIYITK